MTRTSTVASAFKIKNSRLDDREPDIEVQTVNGGFAAGLDTIRSKAQADSAISRLLGRGPATV